VGPLAVEVARGAGKPVVTLLVPDAAVAALHGDRTTGVHMGVSPARQLALIHKLLPQARRIAVIYDPARSQAAIAEARAAAQRLGLTLIETRVESERAVPIAVRRLQGDALWLLVDDTVVTRHSYPLILRASLSAHIPTVTFSQDLVRAGALAALEADFRDSGRKAATLTRRILDGNADLAPVHPEGRLFYNDRVGQQLGVVIPADVRRRVGQVFVP
jgi:putative ABC transport system substrate-binding protein